MPLLLEEQKDKVLSLLSAYHRGELEDNEPREMHPGLCADCRENYLYFTLVSSLQSGRNIQDLWSSALNTYLDVESRYIFDPKLVINHRCEVISKTMSKYGLLLKPSDPSNWYRLCWALYTYYDSNPKRLVEEGEYMVGKIQHIIHKEKPQLFASFREKRLSSYWLYVISKFTDSFFADIYQLSILPDKHVYRASVKLGLITNGKSIEELERKWHFYLLDLSVSPVEMHDALYLWSKADFTFRP
jgi:hypothetical protein